MTDALPVHGTDAPEVTREAVEGRENATPEPDVAVQMEALREEVQKVFQKLQDLAESRRTAGPGDQVGVRASENGRFRSVWTTVV